MHELELTVTVCMGTTGELGNIGELIQWTLPLPLSKSGMQRNVKEYEEMLINVNHSCQDILGPDVPEPEPEPEADEQMYDIPAATRRSLTAMKSLVDQQLKNSLGWLLKMKRMLELQLRGVVAPDVTAIAAIAAEVAKIPVVAVEEPEVPEVAADPPTQRKYDSKNKNKNKKRRLAAAADDDDDDDYEEDEEDDEEEEEAEEEEEEEDDYVPSRSKTKSKSKRGRKNTYKRKGSFFDAFAKQELALQFLEQGGGDCGGGGGGGSIGNGSGSGNGSKYKGNRAALIMKDIVQQITGSSTSAFRLSNFEHVAQNREFCEEALEKRPLHGGAKEVYMVRRGYDEEFRKRMRDYITGMLSRHAETDQAAADAKKALADAAAAAAAAVAVSVVPVAVASVASVASKEGGRKHCRTCGKPGHYATTCGRHNAVNAVKVE